MRARFVITGLIVLITGLFLYSLSCFSIFTFTEKKPVEGREEPWEALMEREMGRANAFREKIRNHCFPYLNFFF